MRRALAVCASALLLAACGANHDPGSTKTESTKAPIIHGQLDTSAHDTVVDLIIIISDTEAAACSGTLIAPNVIITARHCVSNTKDNDPNFGVLADFTPSSISVYAGVTPTGKGLGGQAPLAKGLKIIHDSSTTLINHDIGILITDADVSDNFSPIRLNAPPTKGEAVFDVGYGMTENDSVNSGSLFHQRYIKDPLSIAFVGPSGFGPDAVGSAEIEITGESICEGDSGGPVFDKASGALLAANSRGGNLVNPASNQPPDTCEGSATTNIMTRVDAFSDMITSALASVGEIPWEEGQPKPTRGSTQPDAGTGTDAGSTGTDAGTPPTPGSVGASCAGPADCDTSLCISFGGQQFCSAACTTDAQCPTNFTCGGGYCLPAAPAGDAGAGGDGAIATPDANTQSSSGCSIGSNGTSSGTSFALVGLAAALAIATRRRR